MKRIIILFCGFLVFNCTKQKEQGLNGAWQYISGVYTFNDSTTTFTSDDVNSMKIYSDKYYSMNTIYIYGSRTSGSKIRLGIQGGSYLYPQIRSWSTECRRSRWTILKGSRQKLHATKKSH